jgi:hypothetical protein
MFRKDINIKIILRRRNSLRKIHFKNSHNSTKEYFVNRFWACSSEPAFIEPFRLLVMSFRNDCTTDFFLVNKMASVSQVVEMPAAFAETMGKQNKNFTD